MTGSSTIIPFQSAPQPKATTAVQSRVPRSAVVAINSRGISESRRETSVALHGSASSRQIGPVQGVASLSTLPKATAAGVAPGPREALSDPVFFNAALHRDME